MNDASKTDSLNDSSSSPAPTAPPSLSCAKHGLAASGLCRTCLRDVCPSCSRFIDGATLCETCAAPSPAPAPYTGWTILACIWLVAGPVSLIANSLVAGLEISSLEDSSLLLDPENAEWVLSTSFIILASIIHAGISIITFAHAVRKRKAAILWFQMFFAMNLVLRVVSVLATSDQTTSAGTKGGSPWGGLVWGLVITLAWLKYFRENPKVKATFVR